MSLGKLYLLLDLLHDLFQSLDDNDFESCFKIHDAIGTVNKTIYKKEKIMSDWTPIGHNVAGLSIGEVLEVINDALSHGFEIKVENHTIYYRS